LKIGEVAVSVLITITAGVIVYVTCICAQLIWPPASKVRSELLSAKRTVVDSEFLNVTFISNYDGDTFTVDLPGLPKVFGQHIAVRVKHIDTPELKSYQGEGTCKHPTSKCHKHRSAGGREGQVL